MVLLLLMATLGFVSPKIADSQDMTPYFDPNIIHDLETRSWLEIKNAGIVKQKKDFSCGSGALATILKYYYNEKIKEEDILNWLFDKKNVGADYIEKLNKKISISFYDLKLFAQENGYEAPGFALSPKALNNLRHPVIIYLDIRGNEHFSVFKGISDRFVHLADPTFGNIRMRTHKFKKSFDTRDDRHLQGRILGILGDKEVNEDFFKIPPRTDLVYQLISNKLRMDFK